MTPIYSRNPWIYLSSLSIKKKTTFILHRIFQVVLIATARTCHVDHPSKLTTLRKLDIAYNCLHARRPR